MSAGAIFSVLGGLTALGGGLAAQSASKQQAKNIMYMAGINSANSENSSALEAMRMERLAETSVATIESSYAASGIDISSGSALRVAASEASAAAGTIANFKRNADVQARMIQYQGSLDAYNAKVQGANAAMLGVGTLLGSLGTAFK